MKSEQVPWSSSSVVACGGREDAEGLGKVGGEGSRLN